MSNHRNLSTVGVIALICLGLVLGQPSVAAVGGGSRQAVDLAPSTMTPIGAVDERYQSYNVEMLEVTGGRFWKPYNQTNLERVGKATSANDAPLEKDATLYADRPPIDLSSVRLRRLAAALGPAYVRVSGSWANGIYFPDSDTAPESPPPGFSGVLPRQEWRSVVDFAHAVDAEIVTSFSISDGTRDAQGVWTPAQARRLIDYTESVGGKIAAAEFMNEPTLPSIGHAPAGYNASAYGRDFRIFHDFIKQRLPNMLIQGPGAVGEIGDGTTPSVINTIPGVILTPALMAATGPGVDVFSYHHYGAESLRCAAKGMPQTTPEEALSEAWLSATDRTFEFYRRIRDQYEPGKPLWITEVADTACGGNPWASTFLDTFRYLDQLGRLARQSVQVVMHNTLAASDYGLLDETTLEPRPNYWGALLWRRLMGTTVLDSGIPIQEGLHVYAHCLRGTPGGVAVLAINNDKLASRVLSIPRAADRYTLSSQVLRSARIELNGTPLALDADGQLPSLHAAQAAAGPVTLAPATITFLAVPTAGNMACQ